MVMCIVLFFITSIRVIVFITFAVRISIIVTKIFIIIVIYI